MKLLIALLLTFIGGWSGAQSTISSTEGKLSPLSAYSAEWNKATYLRCNTAAAVTYMNGQEKEVIYILNLARTYPALFASTVLAKYPALSGKGDLSDNKQYYQSLVQAMQEMQPAALLQPSVQCYTSAACHAKTSGERDYVGHERQTAECKAAKYFMGECCDYGHDNPLDIVVSLLIDMDIPSLGHRKILLGNYAVIGVSIQPHKTYHQNTVLNLHKK